MKTEMTKYGWLVRTIVADLKHGYTIEGCERRARRRARRVITRGWRASREHAGDLALQALCDAPTLLGYGHHDIEEYLDRGLRAYERLYTPDQKFVRALVGIGEPFPEI